MTKRKRPKSAAAAAAAATTITKDNPVDILITHVEIMDHKAIRCDRSYQTPHGQYAKSKNREKRPSDQITAYVFGRSRDEEAGSYCIEVPYSPTCYIRVPSQWEKKPGMISGVLAHLLECMFQDEDQIRQYMGCMKGEFVRRLHAFGYRPEPYYLFLKVDCSNRVVYRRLRSLMGSQDTFRRRSKDHDTFYRQLLSPGFLSRCAITNSDEVRDLLDFSVVPKGSSSSSMKWYTREWFVAHEFLDDSIAFLKSINLDINGFVRVTEGTATKRPVRGFSNAGNEIVCTKTSSVQGVDLDTIPKGTLAPVMKMTFDIECTSENIVDHPQINRAKDTVTQIGTKTYPLTDSTRVDRIVFTLGDPALSEKCTYRKFQHETQLLVGFAEYVVEKDIDLYSTFNGMAFDWDYLHRRACLALFAQTSPSFLVAQARWETLHRQYLAYTPLQEKYTALTTEYKKSEQRDTEEFKKKEQAVFRNMAAALGHASVSKNRRISRQPTQDPYNQAIWTVSSVAELRRLYDHFRTQPSITPWFYMHRMRCQKVTFDIRAKSSAALGNQLLKTPNDGRTNSDLYLYIKTAYKMDKYGLDACADKFFNSGNKSEAGEKKKVAKDDLLAHYHRNKDAMNIQLRDPSSTVDAYHIMYEYIASGRPELLRAVCEYCMQDVEVTDKLDVELGVPYELCSMMKRYRVLLQALTRRAQQYRFMTNVAFEIVGKFVFNSYDRTAKAPTYQGAVVLTPKWGLHGAPWEWVFCLDFASLYPTLMREHNLCIRSFILPCDRARVLAMVKAGTHPPILGIPYTQMYTKGRDPIIHITREKVDTVQLTNVALFAIMKLEDTILPKFLKRMGDDRGAVKKDMKKAAAKQVALKTIEKATKAEDWTTHAEYVQKMKSRKRKVDTELEQGETSSKKKKAKLKKEQGELACILGMLEDIPDAKAYVFAVHIDKLGFVYMVLDSEQKAIKIGMNSVYGSLGVKNGTITGLQEIAMSITYCGRMYIYKTRDFCYDYAATTPGWEDLDLEVVYGCV